MNNSANVGCLADLVSITLASLVAWAVVGLEPRDAVVAGLVCHAVYVVVVGVLSVAVALSSK